MRAAVSNVNFNFTEGARISWPVCTAAQQFAFACSRRLLLRKEMSRLSSN
jgi:hypothetical protein